MRWHLLALLGAACPAGAAAADEPGPRKTVPIDSGWEFRADDEPGTARGRAEVPSVFED